MSDEQAMTTAFQLHAAGRVAEAEAIYRQVLAGNPNDAAALHMLGAAMNQRGQRDAAIEHILRAIALQPGVPEFHMNLALVYLEKGDAQKAADAARTSLSLRPNQPRALNHLGNAMKMMGRVEESIECFRSALAAQPDSVPALRYLADSYRRLGRDADADSTVERLLALRPIDLDALGARGEMLFRGGRLAEAEENFQRVIAAHPNHWLGYHGRGVALFELGRSSEAIALLEKSVVLGPDRPGTHDSLGHAYTMTGRLHDAICCLEQSLTLDPKFFSAHNNLGHALAVSGRLDEAIAALRRALAISPTSVDAHNNLGNAYCAKLDFEQGMAEYDAALFFKPDHADSHWNKAILLLMQGDYARGWLEYEWRWLKFASQKRAFRQPLWDGGDISGKSILLHHEQGYGDTIQFIRFAPMIAQRGATVFLETFAELVPLLKNVPGVENAFPPGGSLPAFDVHCPLLSLPFALEITSPSAIPAAVPYVMPPEELRQQWAEVMSPYNSTLKVGIAWAGAAHHARDRDRSIPPQMLRRLSSVTGVRFFSLQKGQGDPRVTPPGELALLDFTDQLTDFAQTAGLIANLDLVISVDTSVAHLAGAMGKPAWLLISHYPDWRWLLDREDSPWYPTVRIFRQPARGDWPAVIERVAGELAGHVKARQQ